MYNELINMLNENDITLDFLAKRLCISVSFLRKKLAGKSEFNLMQINTISKMLFLDSDMVYEIFFKDTVSYKKHGGA